MASSRKRNIEVHWLIDDKQATKSLDKVEKGITKTGKAFSSAAKLIAGFAAGSKVAEFAGDTIRAFSDLNESLNAVEVTFGGAAAGIKKLGEEAATSVGLSNAEFNSLAVGFSAFAEEIAQGSGQTVVPVIDEMTTRIADFASVMNLDVAEAAEKFRAGLAGETEPLRKFGIDVSAAAVNQRALAMGLVESTSELTEQDKILARYNLIMEQTEKSAGDFENTSDSLANQQRILAAETENAKAAFGEGLAPALEAAQATGNDLLTVLGKVTEVATSSEGAVGGMSKGFTTLFHVLTGGVIPALDFLAEKIREGEEAQRELEEAQLDALTPSEAQVKIAESADKVFRLQAEAMEELAEKTDDASTAQQKLSDLQRAAADPAFKLLSAIEQYADAQDDYTEAINKFGDGSSQAQDAALDLAEAQADLNEAGADFSAEGGAASIEALQLLLDKAGVLPETIQAIIDAIKEYNDTPVVRKDQFIPGVGVVKPGSGGAITDDQGNVIGMASGGMVPGPKGAPVPAVVHGGEMVLNPEQQRAVFGGGLGTGASVNLYALSLSDRQLKEVQEMARRS